MTSSRIERLAFTRESVDHWRHLEARSTNWPMVYTLGNAKAIYVGETGNVVARLRQHLQSSAKQELEAVQVIVDDTFNKSACLDLESYLIRLFAGDGKYEVLNRNEGIVDAAYYERDQYTKNFNEIFEELRSLGYFTRTIPQIINSDLFKLSPFKALTSDQAIAVEDILEGLFADLDDDARSTIVIQGAPGTGKTILAIYLMKLLMDIKHRTDHEEPADSLFADFFTDEHRKQLNGFRIGLVVPQQSLRESIKKVFRRTPGLHQDMVLTPFEVGMQERHFDLLIVDEAHRLTQYASQAMGTLTRDFRLIGEKLFGPAYQAFTQLDWIRAKSTHQIFLVDVGQRVRPSDVPESALRELVARARQRDRVYPLTTQMRVAAGSDYVGYIRSVLAGLDPPPQAFGEYDLRLFDDFDEMYDEIQRKERDEMLARLLAGYAWPWRSRRDKDVPDIALGSHHLFWNRSAKDWVSTSNPADEVGSIHTIQGYDLNYAGVVIGKDLRCDPDTGELFFDRAHYFDAKGKANNKLLGVTYSDADLLEFVRNVYAVLLTRGIRGTYLYVCDEPLREYLRRFFPTA